MKRARWVIALATLAAGISFATFYYSRRSLSWQFSELGTATPKEVRFSRFGKDKVEPAIIISREQIPSLLEHLSQAKRQSKSMIVGLVPDTDGKIEIEFESRIIYLDLLGGGRIIRAKGSSENYALSEKLTF